jgi:hypothetical protein
MKCVAPFNFKLIHVLKINSSLKIIDAIAPHYVSPAASISNIARYHSKPNGGLGAK